MVATEDSHIRVVPSLVHDPTLHSRLTKCLQPRIRIDSPQIALGISVHYTCLVSRLRSHLKIISSLSSSSSELASSTLDLWKPSTRGKRSTLGGLKHGRAAFCSCSLGRQGTEYGGCISHRGLVSDNAHRNAERAWAYYIMERLRG